MQCSPFASRKTALENNREYIYIYIWEDGQSTFLTVSEIQCTNPGGEKNKSKNKTKSRNTNASNTVRTCLWRPQSTRQSLCWTSLKHRRGFQYHLSSVLRAGTEGATRGQFAERIEASASPSEDKTHFPFSSMLMRKYGPMDLSLVLSRLAQSCRDAMMLCYAM